MSELEQTSEPVTEPTPAPVAAPVAVVAPAPAPVPLSADAQAAALARLDSLADAHLVTGAHFGKRPAEIVAALLEGTGIALGTVTDTPDVTISAIRFDGEPLRAALDKLARPLGATVALHDGALDFTF